MFSFSADFVSCVTLTRTEARLLPSDLLSAVSHRTVTRGETSSCYTMAEVTKLLKT